MSGRNADSNPDRDPDHIPDRTPGRFTDQRHTRRDWVRLDNASNIFLAARSISDPKVFRMSVEVDHVVDPQLLQEALDETYDRFPLFHAVLRRGIFWYYLQDSDLRPTVAVDDQYTCFPIYQSDRRNLLFRILYYRRRISLEIFHALSDGTGALWFVSDLVTAYLRLRYPDEVAGESSDQDAPLTEPDESLSQARGLVPDSFGHHFRRHRKQDQPTVDFDHAAAGATADFAQVKPDVRLRAQLRKPEKKVYRVRGTRNPDNRTRAVELTVSAKAVLALARAEGVSMTTYLTALFFESIRRAAGETGGAGAPGARSEPGARDASSARGEPGARGDLRELGDARTMSASIPVNLRQFFPSTSARNFFATVHVDHTYGEGPDDLGTIARSLEEDFRPKATPAALDKKLRQLIRLERHQIIRVIPRPLKDRILGLINWGNNRGLTVAISNLGRVSLPDPVDQHVGRMYFHVSAVRPQFCAMSHGDQLTISFTSPFTETDHIREFTRHLTGLGIEVSVAATAVTEAEIAELTP